MIIYITQQNKRTMKNFERTCGCLANDFSLGSPLMTVGYNISPVCSFIISFLTRLPTMSVFSDSSSISLYIAGTGKTEFSRACEVVENDTHLSPPRIYRFTNGFINPAIQSYSLFGSWNCSASTWVFTSFGGWPASLKT